jgi:hypothetical protein
MLRERYGLRLPLVEDALKASLPWKGTRNNRN